MTLYEELGVRTFVNAYGPLTRLGGSLMPTVVVDAMIEASRQNVELAELQYKAGIAIAQLTKNEAAYVSCGAASGIALAVATAMAGTDPMLSEQLPNTAGMKNRVVMHATDRGYKCDVAIRCAGAAIVDIGDRYGATENQLRTVLNSTIAAIVLVDNGYQRKIPIDRVVSIAHERDTPVIMDAAGSVPPIDSFWRFTRDLGVDAVVISGGKGLRGPQSTGLVLGTKQLIDGCRFHGVPNSRVGRCMKVGKEELAGIYAAVKRIMSEKIDFEDVRSRQIECIAAQLNEIAGIQVKTRNSESIEIRVASANGATDYAGIAQKLLNCKPAIYVGHSDSGLIVSSECLEIGEEKIVASQLRSFFAETCEKIITVDRRVNFADKLSFYRDRNMTVWHQWSVSGRVPTAPDVAREMMRIADVGPNDVVYDLGCGEGNIVIAAAQSGARAVGIDICREAIDKATENANSAGVGNRTTFIEGSLFEYDFDDATVVTTYLLPADLEKLRPKLLELRPGTRIVSHSFDLGDLPPQRTIKYKSSDHGERTLYYFVVPERDAPPSPTILTRTLQYLLNEKDANARRIRDLRLVSDYVLALLDDRSVGIARNDFHIGEVQWNRIRDGLLRQLSHDPLLLAATAALAPAGGVAGSVQTALVNALSAPVLQMENNLCFTFSADIPRSIFNGAEVIMMLGAGNFMDFVINRTSAKHVHVCNFPNTAYQITRQEQLEQFRRRGDVELSFSDEREILQKIRQVDLVVINEIALSNGQLDGLLPACARCGKVIIEGPTAAIYPKYLFEAGVQLVITTRMDAKLDEISFERSGRASFDTFRQRSSRLYVWPRDLQW